MSMDPELSCIPIVDFAEWESTAEKKRRIAAELVDACKTVGFVYIINHKIAPEKLAEAFEWSKKLFDLSHEEKMLAPHPDGFAVHRGYSWPGLEKVSNAVGDEDNPELVAKLREVSDVKVLVFPLEPPEQLMFDRKATRSVARRILVSPINGCLRRFSPAFKAL